MDGEADRPQGPEPWFWARYLYFDACRIVRL